MNMYSYKERKIMNNYKIAGLIILIVFYTAYLIKMAGQRKKGIQTIQFGIGKKERRTVIVEKTLQVLSIFIVVVEVVSIVRNTGSSISIAFRFAGLLIAVIGTVTFIAAMCTMQDSWRVGIAEKDSTILVTKGIYQISRNPAFLGFDFVYIGMCISFFNPVLLVVSLLGILVMHMQILEEEKFLIKVYGEAYKEYQQRTGRYFISVLLYGKLFLL